MKTGLRRIRTAVVEGILQTRRRGAAASPLATGFSGRSDHVSRRQLCGIFLVLLLGSGDVLGGDHKHEGKIVGAPGHPAALVYQGKLIKIENANLVYCLATENVTLSKAEYEAIP